MILSHTSGVLSDSGALTKVQDVVAESLSLLPAMANFIHCKMDPLLLKLSCQT